MRTEIQNMYAIWYIHLQSIWSSKWLKDFSHSCFQSIYLLLPPRGSFVIVIFWVIVKTCYNFFPRCYVSKYIVFEKCLYGCMCECVCLVCAWISASTRSILTGEFSFSSFFMWWRVKNPFLNRMGSIRKSIKKSIFKKIIISLAITVLLLLTKTCFF